MMDLVNGLLELAKVDTLQQTFQPCDMGQVTQAVIVEYQDRAFEKRIKLVHKTNTPITPIVGDLMQLKSAISNLVDNAIKYSPENSEISVLLEENDGYVLIQVKDQGPGISSEDLPHIFEKFYRGANGVHDSKGVGLGLSLVESIAKAHGGGVWVESQQGQGSIFFLQLPTMAVLRNINSGEG